MDEELFNEFYVTKFYSFNCLFSSAGMGKYRKDRNSWGIIYKFEGETEYKVSKKKITSDSYNLVILPKGVSYTWNCKKSGHFYALEFDADKTYDKIISLPISNKDELLKIYNKLEQESKLFNIFYSLKGIQIIYEILYTLFNQRNINSNDNEKLNIITPAIDFINDHYTEDIDNNLLSSLCFISNSYFRKLFLAHFGTSPIKYITKLRIEKAKELLCGDYSNISDIAIQVGYDNVYHFSKVFKNNTGYSPLNYLKNLNIKKTNQE